MDAPNKVTSEQRAADQERQREVAAIFETYWRKLDAGVCPHCDTAIARKRQVGRCVYAEPCGCRLYQGRA